MQGLFSLSVLKFNLKLVVSHYILDEQNFTDFFFFLSCPVKLGGGGCGFLIRFGQQNFNDKKPVF